MVSARRSGMRRLWIVVAGWMLLGQEVAVPAAVRVRPGARTIRVKTNRVYTGMSTDRTAQHGGAEGPSGTSNLHDMLAPSRHPEDSIARSGQPDPTKRRTHRELPVHGGGGAIVRSKTHADASGTRSYLSQVARDQWRFYAEQVTDATNH